MSTSDGVNEVSRSSPTNAPGAPYESVVIATPTMKPSRGRGRIIAGAVVFAAVVVASFVLKPKDPEAFSLKASVVTTQNVERLRFEVDALSFGAETRETITGLMDVDNGLMQIELSSAQADGSAGIPRAVYVDLDAQVMYMSGEGYGQPLPYGKTWIRFDQSDGPSRESNPVFDAVALAGQATNIEDLGRETILDGVAAEHFRFDVNTDDALMAVAGITRSALDQVDAGFTALPDVLEFEVWVDAHNFIRQFALTLALPDGDATFSARFTEINPAVEITLPMAEQTVDISELSGN